MWFLFVFTLSFSLLSTAGALNCVQDSHRSSEQSSRFPEPCKYPDAVCLTSAVQVYVDDVLRLDKTTRSCSPSSICSEGNQLFSISYSSYKLTSFLQCCSTDGCNYIRVPYPDEKQPNDLQCATSDEWGLPQNQTLKCVGIQDRCFALNVIDGDKTRLLRGCASANLCEGDTEMKLMAVIVNKVEDFKRVKFSALKCCETSLCDSAPSDKLSVIPLLLALVSLSWR